LNPDSDVLIGEAEVEIGNPGSVLRLQDRAHQSRADRHEGLAEWGKFNHFDRTRRTARQGRDTLDAGIRKYACINSAAFSAFLEYQR
jgi:hypothetical protein